MNTKYTNVANDEEVCTFAFLLFGFEGRASLIDETDDVLLSLLLLLEDGLDVSTPFFGEDKTLSQTS